jgi:predicted ATP-grasp superfamily ATP-dependent carboligase
MRILVHEFVSGGGLAGRPVPRSLGREGLAMLTALVADLAAMSSHQVVTTVDGRFPLKAPRAVEVVPLPASPGRPYPRNLDPLIASVDAVWLIAPETDRCLERLAAHVERRGAALLGSPPAPIRIASDKAGLARLFRRHGIPHPATRTLRLTPGGSSNAGLEAMARAIGYPLVVKPARGAGSEGVWLVRDARELRSALQAARKALVRRVLLQQYVPGVPASVSLLADGRRAVAVAVNSQNVRPGRPFTYEGGRTPLVHPLARQAADVTVRACEVVPGLRGYVGIDVILTSTDVMVVEINPRLTTAYLGVRRAFRENVAELGMAACAGVLPPPLTPRRPVRFSADGRILR